MSVRPLTLLLRAGTARFFKLFFTKHTHTHTRLCNFYVCVRVFSVIFIKFLLWQRASSFMTDQVFWRLLLRVRALPPPGTTLSSCTFISLFFRISSYFYSSVGSFQLAFDFSSSLKSIGCGARFVILRLKPTTYECVVSVKAQSASVLVKL